MMQSSDKRLVCGVHLVAAFVAVVLAFSGGASFAQQEQSLAGKWRLSDQSLTVNIAACANATDLCATVVDEVLAPGEKSSVGTILVKDIRKDTKGGWRGKFIDGKSEIDATIRMKDPVNVDFKGCAFLFVCETQSFQRIK
jgi:uncharacterized protein (DUF2147 family)